MRLFILLVVFLLSNSFVFSQDYCSDRAVKKTRSSEIILDNVKGFGINQSDAIKDAKNLAISQAVGSYIQSEVSIEGDDIDYDKVYEYGKGLVQDFCIIKSDRISSREFSISLKAIVAKEKILPALKQAGVKIKLDGKNIARITYDDINRNESELEQVKMILSKVPAGDLYTYEIKSLGIKPKAGLTVGTRTTEDKEEQILKLAIAVKPNYQNYIENLGSSFKNLSDKSVTDDFIFSIKDKNIIYFPVDKDKDKIESQILDNPSKTRNRIMFIHDVKEIFPSSDLNRVFKSGFLSSRKERNKEKYFKVYKGVNFHVNATLLSFLNPESFTAVENALTAKLSSDNFTISFKDYRGNNVVEDLNGVFSNSNMTLTLGGVGSQTKLKYANDSRSLNSYPFNRYNSYNKRPSKSKLKPRLVKREYWNFKQYQLNRLYVNYEGGTYSRQNTYSNYSRRTQRSQQANIGTCTICMEYLSNDGGSFFRQRLMTDIGFWGSVVPLFHALSKKSSWDDGDSHGFSSEYNPYTKYVTNTAWTAAAGATVFGLWRMMLWDADISLDLILKKGPKENVRMYNSDIDFLRSTVTLNAIEQGLITKNHDIFDWDPVNPESGKNKNKTLAIFYIEIPIKISDVKNISSIEIE